MSKKSKTEMGPGTDAAKNDSEEFKADATIMRQEKVIECDVAIREQTLKEIMGLVLQGWKPHVELNLNYGFKIRLTKDQEEGKEPQKGALAEFHALEDAIKTGNPIIIRDCVEILFTEGSVGIFMHLPQELRKALDKKIINGGKIFVPVNLTDDDVSEETAKEVQIDGAENDKDREFVVYIRKPADSDNAERGDPNQKILRKEDHEKDSMFI
jgi:hypothetical protein